MAEIKNIDLVLFIGTFLLLGILIGVSQNENKVSGASQTLDRYPLDISLSSNVKHSQQIFSGSNVPKVDLKVHKDKMADSDLNLEIDTENFSFAPENISDDHVSNEGHAHVYVDGILMGRAYSDWYHLPRVEPGKHNIKVTLNTNNHREYYYDGAKIMDVEEVEVK